MSAAKKLKECAPGELETQLIDHAVSADVTRSHLNKPFGQFFDKPGKGYIVGTDGHRLAAIQSDAWPAYKRDDAPPAQQVIPFDAKWLGTIKAENLDGAHCFPRKWDARIHIQPQCLIVHADFTTGKGRTRRKIRILDHVKVDWFKLEQLSFSVGMCLSYLLDAVQFIGTNEVHVWGSSELAPVAFTSNSKPIAEAQRIAIVCPMRL